MFSDRQLRSLAKPTRYSGGEPNAVPPKRDPAATMLLVFPDLYEIGMSSLGFKILYHLVNEHPDYWADFAFSPWVDAEAVMRESQIPLFGLTSRRPAREFDVIAFSVGHEMGYTNVLNAIDLAGLPVASAERADDAPIIIAGGNCSANPMPMADFIDAFYVGEGEAQILKILDTVAANKGRGRSATLSALATVPGVYVPSVHAGEPIQRQYVEDFENSYYPVRQITALQEIEHDRVAVEIMRGCPHACKFCQATVCYRPVRHRSAQRIFDLAEAVIRETGCDEISLNSLSSTDHPQIEEIAHGLMERFEGKRVSLALPSIRANPRWVALAADIQKVRKTGLTLAPEAGSQRLRDAMAKQVTDDEIYQAAEAAFKAGWDRMKLYFMIGLPGETEDDIRAIGDMARKIMSLSRGGRPPSLNVSVTTFIPKPGTRWEREGQDTLDVVTEKHRLLLDGLRGRNMKVSWHDPRTSRLEAAFALGDRRVGGAISHAWKSGAKFDGWDEHLNHARWAEAFQAVGLTMEGYANRGYFEDDDLPWSFIQSTPGQPGVGGIGSDREVRAYPKATHRLINGAGISHMLRFSKMAQARWISHLDLAKAWDRAARRAGLPIAYSHGFNPRPKITFDGAMPVGMTSECEHVHIMLAKPIPSPDVVAMLNSELPPGVTIVDALDISGRPGGVFPPPAPRTYVYSLTFVDPPEPGAVNQAIAAITAKKGILVTRPKGDQTKEVDVRLGIQSLTLDTENGTDARIVATLSPDNAHTPKAGELAEMLFALLPPVDDWCVHRSG